MTIEKKDNLCNLTSQVKALNTLQSEYFSQMTFINDLRETLENSYNSETNKYEQKGVDKLIKKMFAEADGFIRTSGEISTENYYINSIVKGLTDKIQKEVMTS